MSRQSTDLAIRSGAIIPAAPQILSDDEIRRIYRTAEGLAASGVYKDARDAKQAFAKMVVGRDLGLSPAQAMQGLYFVEGHVQVHYATLGRFVRANGYDFRFGTGNVLKIRKALGDAYHGQRFWPIEPTNDSVTVSFWGPVDETGQREWLGDSTFTQEDAARAGKSGGNYQKYPRNMLTARAMSNGVRWYVPEATGGIPVYVEGEIEPAPQLSAGDSDGQPRGLDLGPKVDAVIDRAGELGHAQYADRATVEMILGNRSPETVNRWVAQANLELDRMAEPVSDAEIVDTEPEAEPDVEAEIVPDGMAEELRARANDLADKANEAAAAGDEDSASHYEYEAVELRKQADRLDGVA